MVYAAILPSPIGFLGLQVTDSALVKIDFLPDESKPIKPVHRIAALTAEWLQRYFEHAVWSDLPPLEWQGTPFQQKVWSALGTIPPGQVREYGELARSLGSAARAVGGACRANPVPILVPCHRVVGKHGLGGYCGTQVPDSPPLTKKDWLLAHERHVV